MPEPMNLREVMESYLANLKDRGCRPATIRQTVWQLKLLNKRLDTSLTPTKANVGAMVDQFCAERRAEGLRATSINTTLRCMRAALRLAYDREQIEGMRPPKVRMLKEERLRVQILESSDVDRLLAFAVSSRARLAIALGAYAGLRHQEILHLQLRDLDMGVPQVLVTMKSGWVTKSFHERAVPMTKKLVAEVWRYLDSIQVRPGTDEWVFTGFSNNPFVAAKTLTANRLTDIGDEVRESFQMADLYVPKRKPGLHMLRRTFASQLLERGADIETVRDLMGHWDISVTAAYLGTNDRKRRSAVELLEQS